jgi:ribosomal protein L14E/L6E/L27E
MEGIEIGDVVLNLNGRDKGHSFFVTARDGEYITLADGRCRRIEKPKRKKARHVRKMARSLSRAADKLRNSEKVTNAELRRALGEYEKGPDFSEEACILG